MSTGQGTLFDLPPPEVASAERFPAPLDLPRTIRFGGMSWNYPGWRGSVYSPRVSEEAIAKHGLTAYAKHPHLRAVEIDRTYYESLPEEAFADFARQVPDDFRFIVKAHEDATVARYPNHARYGKMRGELNRRYLDASYVTEQVLGPIERGLGPKLAAVLLQFPPHDPSPTRFVDELHRFLRRLPTSVRCAVEIRNPELLTRAYGEALVDTGAVHCHNAWTAMPDVVAQARAIPPAARHPVIVRWLARQGEGYEEAQRRFAPFDRLLDEDVATRNEIARLTARAALHGVPSFVLVSNHAEGTAPESIARLAQAIAKSDALGAR